MTSTVLTAVLAVFTAIGEWIGTAITALTPMFYVAETGLTFLGTLAVAGLGFSVIFLKSIGHYASDCIYESPLIAGNSFFQKTISSEAA